ncbi:MAG: DNA polymerase III subunit beta [Bacillota bacterium]|nr:DNA polymerase III subunit beta [Bacillota bacterium]
MKVSCSKENLTEGINMVQKAVSSKSTLPILEGILIEANQELKLTGNDLELGIECKVPADIQENGSIVINSKIFGDIVRRLPDAEVFIEVTGSNMVIIECENSHFEIKGIPSSGFPALPEIKKENAFVVNQEILRNMIKQTLFAVSMDENRPILTGSLMECKDKKLTFVSIDGFRMALRNYEVDNEAENLKVVIPGKTLNEILKILQPVKDEVSIYSTNNQILFDMNNCKVVSRLLEGEYLNYNGIIPQDYEIKIKVNTKELLAGIERASLVTVDEKRYPVKFNIANDKMVITSNTDIGAVREELKIDMDGGKMDIGFNPRYFIDALKVIEEEQINIFLTSNVGPCTIRPVDKDRFAYMVLPVRTRNE